MSEAGEKPKTIHWTEMLEEYFASTGEKAHCLSWCHKKAEAMYSNRKTLIDLPVIVISGVTGFLSAGSTTMFSNAAASSIALGVASLFVSVLNTAGSYYGWAKRSEGHRISAIHYARLYRFISVELALPRDERMQPNDFLKYVKDQYDRLQEISPLLPPEVISEFQTKFANETEISKPEEANGLEKITVYRNDVNYNVSDPNDARSPVIKVRTPPRLASAASALVAAFQASKRDVTTVDTATVKPLVPTVQQSKRDLNVEKPLAAAPSTQDIKFENPMLKPLEAIQESINVDPPEEVKKNPAVEALKRNPIFKALQMARKVSPNGLTAEAPAPPPMDSSDSECSTTSASSRVEVVVEDEETKPSS